MSLYGDRKIESALAELAAEFITKESSGGSLITVTGARISSKHDRATILVTVFPDNKEEAALDFLGRKKREFVQYLVSHVKMRRLPAISFSLDLGEKNRQRLDTLSYQEAQRRSGEVG